MSREQLQQNKKQQPQQNRKTQKTSGNDGEQYFGGLRQEVKSSVAEMLAAAQALINGTSTPGSVEAASYFGNQTMLNMAEQHASQRNSIKSAGDVLSGEKDCVFANDPPINEIAADPAFPAECIPDFSPDVPATDIMQVGQLAMQYLN